MSYYHYIFHIKTINKNFNMMKGTFLCLILLVLTTFASCYNRWTPSNDYGDGVIFYLDRHYLQCNPGEGLTAFHLWRPNANRISYEYQCDRTAAIDVSSAYEAATTIDGVASNWKESAQFLDRHPIVCRQDYVLTGFSFHRFGNQFRYNYRCVAMKVTFCVEDVYTNWNDGNLGTVAYLDRHAPTAPSGAFLTKIRLEASYFSRGWGRADGVNLRYKYSYCYYRDVDTEKAKYQNNKHSRPSRVALEYKEDEVQSLNFEDDRLKKTESVAAFEK